LRSHIETAAGYPREIETRPLEGFRIGVTADRRAEEQSEMLRRRGARVLHGPTIRTMPLGPDEGLRPVTEKLIANPPDVLVANTGIGVRSWFAAAESWGLGQDLLDALAQSQVFARGPKAAGAILTAGLPVAWRAPSETLAELVRELLRGSVAGRRIAVQLDGNVEQREAARLRDAGAAVFEVPVYQWTLPEDERPAVRLAEAACDRHLDAVTFTSAAALDNLFALAHEHDLAPALREALDGPVVAMCVGPVCARTAAAHGVRGVEPGRARLGAMVRTLTEHLAERRRELHLSGTQVVVQGALVVVDGEHVMLTERERAVLDVLLAAAGAVISRRVLLRAVWNDPTTEEHTLEVTVARLRKQLGSAGSALQTVVRRGYRLEVK
jgi:uroporphyrinogen-III synthase